MKTLKYWNNEGGCFTSYVSPGDEIDEAMFDYFLGSVPPRHQDSSGFLMGEASTVDPDGKPMYMYFSNINGKFHYVGLTTLQKFIKGV